MAEEGKPVIKVRQGELWRIQLDGDKVRTVLVACAQELITVGGRPIVMPVMPRRFVIEPLTVAVPFPIEGIAEPFVRCDVIHSMTLDRFVSAIRHIGLDEMK